MSTNKALIRTGSITPLYINKLNNSLKFTETQNLCNVQYKFREQSCGQIPEQIYQFPVVPFQDMIILLPCYSESAAFSNSLTG